MAIYSDGKHNENMEGSFSVKPLGHTYYHVCRLDKNFEIVESYSTQCDDVKDSVALFYKKEDAQRLCDIWNRYNTWLTE